MVKSLPAMQETRAQSPGREDPLEDSMATPSSTLAWEIPWREEPGGLQSTGSQKAGPDLAHMPQVSELCSDFRQELQVSEPLAVLTQGLHIKECP